VSTQPRTFEELALEALPITRWISGSTVLELHTADAPHVRGILHAQAMDPGRGEASGHWTFDNELQPSQGVLEVTVVRPVHCQFGILFDLIVHRELLHEAERQGGLHVALVPFQQVGDEVVVRGVSLAIPRTELRLALQR
jgi:hypothetical protein